jgi:beta-lactamase regulating signal transducer with metallopeptidase domain
VSALVDAGMFAKGWLATLGLVAVQGALLALVAFALTRAARLHPGWQAAIWLVVTIKLAVPWGPAMPWSFSDLIATFTASEPASAPLVLTTGMASVAPSAAPLWPALAWLALATLWAAGAASVIGRAVAAHLHTMRAARSAPAAPADARDMLVSLARRMRVGPPRLAVATTDAGPHVVGVLRPIIVVPPALLAEPSLLRAALLHELAHVRRHDALARLIQIAAGAMMWWLPVARIVHRKLELAREAACDAWALELGDVGRPAYARLLVRMAQLRADVAAPALAAHHALDARVAAVLGPPARARMGHVHRVAIAGWAALALGGARTASAASEPDVCHYTSQIAEALYLAFPQADRDGDGQLSRDEACELQADLRREPEVRTARITPENEAHAQTLLAEPLCCNCGGAEVYSSPEIASCQKVEGAER